MNNWFECCICNKRFNTQRGRSVHLLWHDSNYLKNYRIKRRREDVQNKQKEIIVMYVQGKSLEKIAKIFSCSVTSIRNLLTNSDIEIRPQIPFQFGNTLGKGKFGIQNGNWKGDDAKYHAIHDWIKKNKPKPQLCEICNEKKPREIANKSGEYLRDVNDYWWTCTSCHHVLDGTIKNIKHMKNKLEG